MQEVKVLRPSSDSQTSISHPVKSRWGSTAFHSILTFLIPPLIKKVPNTNEILSKDFTVTFCHLSRD